MRNLWIFNQLFRLNDIYGYTKDLQENPSHKDSLITFTIEHYNYLRNCIGEETLNEDLIKHLSPMLHKQKISYNPYDEELIEKLEIPLHKKDLISFIKFIGEIEDVEFVVYVLKNVIACLLKQYKALLFSEFQAQNITFSDIRRIVRENDEELSGYYEKPSIVLLLCFAVYLFDNNKMNTDEIKALLTISFDFLKENFYIQLQKNCHDYSVDIEYFTSVGDYEAAVYAISNCYGVIEESNVFSREYFLEKTDKLTSILIKNQMYFLENIS